MKKRTISIIIIAIITIIMVVSLFLLLKSLTVAKSKDVSTIETLSTYKQELQSQIDDLNNKTFAFNSVVTQLQSQIKTLATPVTSTVSQEFLDEISDITKSINKLNTAVGSLQTQVTALQDSLKAAETTIGTTSININGLSIVFITNYIDIGMTGYSVPNIAQFAVKIINTTGSALTNIDVTGGITSSLHFSGVLASGYPQLVDGAGLCSYAYSCNESNTINFEAYANTKTSLSIPVGGSITLRPKLSILAARDQQLPGITFTLSLNTITYDVVAAK